MALDEKWEVTCRLPRRGHPDRTCDQYMGRPHSLVQAINTLMVHVIQSHGDQDVEALYEGSMFVDIRQLRWEKLT